ncbi:hypothetical protein OFR22_09025 [Brachyspira hyodysenteriae]|uniref:hypothetical protein n=1 Tax=Brachyspira hyodysenteriae TaxID=159 RepID=UPI0022CD8462|nr:hypothetical protein [Brachyspira hyodysenteriae]MCZ9839472.1 hypothetical protein [Brachyspira hyodysenteriae]MCZ9847118.1 hypothetical protein [Brachyspira hyodysenteriae]MCZ9850709.1 hypothetical protein [Brachyspira hyodysenteriae]MCZ9860538.1 hypothetical protein [Brachyspira hyodysenteriae]MCZ9869961.1 hypothetical protein [Brachyspira hyodysenteriae]
MNKFQNKIYYKKLIKNILDNIKEDDYFYNKKTNWEEWVIMRVDINNAISKLDDIDISNYKPEVLERILYILKEY